MGSPRPSGGRGWNFGRQGPTDGGRWGPLSGGQKHQNSNNTCTATSKLYIYLC